MPARGTAPGKCPRSLFRPARAEGIPAPLQGALIDSETQGVALGYHAAAPSAPEPKLYKPEFRSFDGWPFMRWLLFRRSTTTLECAPCPGSPKGLHSQECLCYCSPNSRQHSYRVRGIPRDNDRQNLKFKISKVCRTRVL